MLGRDMSQPATWREAEDIELVRAFRDGSSAAFDELFMRYHTAISALTNRLVRDSLLAEDLTQETFFRVLRSLDRVDAGFNFQAWIHRIATNLCYDELRRRKRTQPAPTEDGVRAASQSAPGEDPDEVLGHLPSQDGASMPEDALAMRELRREVWDVAASLPENYRQVLSLRELQGLSYNAIAEVMGLSPSAIETLLHRARRRFKLEYLSRSFEESAGEDRCVALQELMESFPLTGLRGDRRTAVLEHIRGCAACRAFAAELDTSRPKRRTPSVVRGRGAA